MFHTSFLPNEALREYVDSIHVVEIDFILTPQFSPIYTYVPTFTRYLTFYFQDPIKVKKDQGGFESRSRAVVIGPQLTPVTLDLGRNHSALMVALKPSGLYRLLGIPLVEIIEQDFDASQIIGKEIDEVTDQLYEAREPAAKNSVIQSYLLKKLSHLKAAQPFDLIMQQLVSAKGNLSIDHISSLSSLSVRQFERKSLERVGLPPKLYARMIRFTHAYKFKEQSPDTSWNEIAHRCGYYDQMHFIRDFKYFAGFTPGMLKEEDMAGSIKFNKYH